MGPHKIFWPRAPHSLNPALYETANVKVKSSENLSKKWPNFGSFLGLGSGVRKSFDFYCKRHIYTWIHVVCDIPRENWLGMWPPGRLGKKKVTNIVYFTYLPRSPRCSDRHQIFSGADFQDVINCAKFHSNPFRSFDFAGGRILAFPIGMRCRRH